MGNSVEQWRTSIGCWNRAHLMCATARCKESCSSPWFQLLVLVALLLIGGIEMNPGPNQVIQPQRERRSGCKTLAIIIPAGVVVALVIALFFTVDTKGAEHKNSQPAGVCETEECVRSAARIRDSLDRSVDPCDDFYQFACGDWITRNPVPDSQTKWDQIRALREQLLIQLRGLLEEEGSSQDEKSVQQARTLYKTCLDTGKLEERGVEPLRELLEKVGFSFAGLPTSVEEFDWLKTTAVIRKLDLHALFSFWVSQDVRNNSRYVMMADQASLDISESYFLDPMHYKTELTEYHRYVRDMVYVYQRHLNYSIQSAAELADEIADKILDFSTKLASIHVSIFDLLLSGDLT